MSVPAMGIAPESKATTESVYNAALALGIATQLTNILRDVGEEYSNCKLLLYLHITPRGCLVIVCGRLPPIFITFTFHLHIISHQHKRRISSMFHLLKLYILNYFKYCCNFKVFMLLQ